MSRLSPRQAIVLKFIGAEVKRCGVSPSFREIADHLGVVSTNSIHSHVRALKSKGYLECVGAPGAARSLRLTAAAQQEQANTARGADLLRQVTELAQRLLGILRHHDCEDGGLTSSELRIIAQAEAALRNGEVDGG